MANRTSAPPRLLITCEHASASVPAALRDLGLSHSVLRQHVGWDPGALPVARALARAFAAPLHQGRWSRLVADLNRSSDHPRVIATRVLGRPVPGNAALDAAARAVRLRRYWEPYRAAVAADAAAFARAAAGCVHLSVHSFVERLHGIERRADVGILFDPRRPRERALATALQRALQSMGLLVRKNFPYFGHTDGMTTALRQRLPANRYLGLELELNQRRARTAAGQRQLAAALVAALQAVGPRAMRRR